MQGQHTRNKYVHITYYIAYVWKKQ